MQSLSAMPKPWPVLVNSLVTEGHVHPDAAVGTARLWAFGMLIGSTDMRRGNLSFISNHGRPYHLATAYDILPMGFVPRTGGAIVNELRPASLPEVISRDIWQEALGLTKNFFVIANSCERFSANFVPYLEALRYHLDEVRSRIAHLG